jgi:hypothetical protein
MPQTVRRHLGVTADERGQRVRIGALRPSREVSGLSVGDCRHRAGIYNIDIRDFICAYHFKTRVRKAFAEQLSFVLINLTAQRIESYSSFSFSAIHALTVAFCTRRLLRVQAAASQLKFI